MAGEHGYRTMDDYLSKLTSNRNALQRARTPEDRKANLARISATADCLLAEVEMLFNRITNEEKRRANAITRSRHAVAAD